MSFKLVESIKDSNGKMYYQKGKVGVKSELTTLWGRLYCSVSYLF